MTSADIRSEPQPDEHMHRGQVGLARVLRPVDATAASIGDGAPETRGGYWDDFYATTAANRRPLPSQFATFVAGELAGPSRIIEFGSGGGRDAIFFADNGHDVIGIDASAQAVATSRALAEHLGVDAD